MNAETILEVWTTLQAFDDNELSEDMRKAKAHIDKEFSTMLLSLRQFVPKES